eukprot:9262470-Alexandrium_andersonii.AAC.1
MVRAGPGNSPEIAPPRVTWRDRGAPLPTGLDHRRMLRRTIRVVSGGTLSRCQLPHSLWWVFESIDVALAEVRRFVEELLREEAD